MGSITKFHQSLYNADLPPITLEHVDLSLLTSRSIFDLTTTLDEGTRLGVAAAYGKKCVLEALALSTATRTLVITMNDASRTLGRPKQILRNELLCDLSFEKHGFFMERLAAALYLDLGLYIRNAFDVTSAGDGRGSMASYKSVLVRAQPQYSINEPVIERIFAEQPFILSRKEEFAMRAWGTYLGVQRFPDKPGVIDTSAKPLQELEWMSKCVRDADRSDSLKPHYTVNDVSPDFSVSNGTVDLECTRFKTRIRKSGNQHIKLGTDQGEIEGHVNRAKGRAVKISPHSQFPSTAIITSVVTIGKDRLNDAGSSRADLILTTFQGSDVLLSCPFVRTIFFPEYPLHDLKWPKLPPTQPKVNFTYRQLNTSQTKAVEKCLSNSEEDRHVVIIGPPGTGKTTVIAAVVHSQIAEHRSNTVWVIAQSNVAVKNIAEKLAESEFFDFALLVSEDFHFDWHEHLYETIAPKVISSDRFKDTELENERLLGGARVILCTISMLSGRALMRQGFTTIVPVQTVIVDEASQIEVGNYLSLLGKYKGSLRKLVFIGDDKQLAPHGKEDIPELRSVFEWPHMMKNAVFLNIQYRMPTVIGNFISTHVYNSKLLTTHKIRSQTCCRFVDVGSGEESKKGLSWMNAGEVKASVHIAKRFIREDKNFKIITPYDAQRNAIENALKTAGLPWENTVFNVDSFQGNEEDHIVVSIVRTSEPGFMRHQRRTNVMLSRCKKSMVILTHRLFLQNKSAAKTLVGQFGKEHIPRTGWVTLEDLALDRW